MQDSPAPVVFQCVKCRSVLTDSHFYACSNDDTGDISFRAVTDAVVVSESFSTSSSGLDKGSTYRQLSCAECTAALGKMYLTTPAALDFLRDRYSLAFAAVTSYMLGSCHEGSSGSASDVSPEQLQRWSVTSPVASDVYQKLSQVMVLLLGLHERLEDVEKRSCSGPRAPPDAAAEEALPSSEAQSPPSHALSVQSARSSPRRTGGTVTTVSSSAARADGAVSVSSSRILRKRAHGHSYTNGAAAPSTPASTSTSALDSLQQQRHAAVRSKMGGAEDTAHTQSHRHRQAED